MQYIPLEDKIIEVDEVLNTSRVLIKSDLQAELDHANYNIQELTKMISELEEKVASTDHLDEKQLEAVNQFNDSLGINNYQRQLEQFTDQKNKLEVILK